jgi:hypothetical protein
MHPLLFCEATNERMHSSMQLSCALDASVCEAKKPRCILSFVRSLWHFSCIRFLKQNLSGILHGVVCQKDFMRRGVLYYEGPCFLLAFFPTAQNL